jgi:hypothetical protein
MHRFATQEPPDRRFTLKRCQRADRDFFPQEICQSDGTRKSNENQSFGKAEPAKISPWPVVPVRRPPTVRLAVRYHEVEHVGNLTLSVRIFARASEMLNRALDEQRRTSRHRAVTHRLADFPRRENLFAQIIQASIDSRD